MDEIYTYSTVRKLRKKYETEGELTDEDHRKLDNYIKRKKTIVEDLNVASKRDRKMLSEAIVLSEVV